jgi:hypothetical protein
MRGASRESLPAQLRDPTRDSIAGSLPRYQGAGERELRPSAGPPPRRSRRGPYLTLVAVGVLAAAGFAVLGRDRTAPPGAAATGQDVHPGAAEPPTPPTIAELVTSGDTAAWHQRVDTDLRGAIQSGRLQRQGFVVDALALTHARAALPMLYVALQGAPELRVKAARVLGELGLPDAVPRLRAALAESGDKIKVEIAAPLFRLGDKDARAILVRALTDVGLRLTAATALAESADDAGRAVLADVMEATPPGRDTWRRAAGGLAKFGDAAARTLLEGELAQADAARSVGVAECWRSPDSA